MTQNIDSTKWRKVLDRIAYQESGHQDARISHSRLRYMGNGELRLPSALDAGYKVVKLNDFSSAQLNTQLQVPTPYLQRLEARNSKLATELVNDALQSTGETSFFRFSDDRVRGVLPKRMPSADNHAIVKAMDNVLSIGDHSFVVRATALDDNRFYLKILFDDEYRDQTGIVQGNYLKVGVVCRTSEIGHGQISVKPFVYRWSCTNDAVVASDHAFSTRDFSLSQDELMNSVSSVVAYARSEAGRLASDMLDTQQKTVTRPQALLQDLAKQLTLSKTETKKLIKAYRDEPMPTRYGVAQAVTRYAQTLTLDARDNMELVGGRLMSEPNVWTYRGITL